VETACSCKLDHRTTPSTLNRVFSSVQLELDDVGILWLFARVLRSLFVCGFGTGRMIGRFLNEKMIG
jgi:hypothetical protein